MVAIFPLYLTLNINRQLMRYLICSLRTNFAHCGALHYFSFEGRIDEWRGFTCSSMCLLEPNLSMFTSWNNLSSLVYLLKPLLDCSVPRELKTAFVTDCGKHITGHLWFVGGRWGAIHCLGIGQLAPCRSLFYLVG